MHQHRSGLAMRECRRSEIQVVEYPDYLLGTLTHSTVPKPQKFINGKSSTKDNVLAAKWGLFWRYSRKSLMNETRTLEHCWNKYIDIKGDYIKKQSLF